jgi:hypothetical protein
MRSRHSVQLFHVAETAGGRLIIAETKQVGRLPEQTLARHLGGRTQVGTGHELHGIACEIHNYQW